MRLRVTRQMPATLWRMFASGCVAAFLLTLALSAAPWLHDQLHPSQGTEHACAVTLISSGGCEHFTHAAPSGLPDSMPQVESIHAAPSLTALGPVSSSILEHAPPRLA